MSHQELIQLITDALAKSPATGADAVALYKELSKKLAHHLVDNLPSLEEKALALAHLVMRDSVTVVRSLESGWSCCKK